MPGSGETFPGEYTSLAAGFASGKPLDVAPGSATLGSFLEDMAGEDDRYAGASDDELQGVICGWERDEANAAFRSGKSTPFSGPDLVMDLRCYPGPP
jgi:hypothetical protein